VDAAAAVAAKTNERAAYGYVVRSFNEIVNSISLTKLSKEGKKDTDWSVFTFIII
jgi:hypothetical protein